MGACKIGNCHPMETTDMMNSVLSLDDRLRQYAFSLTHNQEDAEDLVQDTYLKVLQNTDRFAETTNLKAWVCTIMRNTFINGYRRKQRSKVITDESDDNALFTSTATVSSDAADLPLYVSEITTAISSMKDNQRDAFEMYVDGFKYHEIADKLQISIGTVKSRIFFARQKLMTNLTGYSEAELPLTA